MLKRAWMVLAVLWAVFFLWEASGRTEPAAVPGTRVLVVALGPLAVPWLLGMFFRFVITGSFRRSPVRVYR
jgi:hypothetical protein